MKLKQIFSRDMIILVLGQVISLFGNAIVRFALPLYLLRETNSPSPGWLQPVPFCPWWCFPSWAAELRTG